MPVLVGGGVANIRRFRVAMPPNGQKGGGGGLA